MPCALPRSFPYSLTNFVCVPTLYQTLRNGGVIVNQPQWVQMKYSREVNKVGVVGESHFRNSQPENLLQTGMCMCGGTWRQVSDFSK